MKFSSHELAKRLMSMPDLPLVLGRDLDIYICEQTEVRITPTGRILFDRDKSVTDETKIQTIWLSGPFI